ncbi:MAG TPA: hypothetical protein VGM23_13860, partial [Armatimonadota bacterium]
MLQAAMAAAERAPAGYSLTLRNQFHSYCFPRGYRMSRFFLPALLLGVLLGVGQMARAAETPQRVALRGLGTLTVTSRLYPATHASWITFTAQDAPHATRCGSKFLADLLGFGDLHVVANADLPGTTVALDGTACWLIGLQGTACHILCARTREELAALARRADSAGWQPVAQHAYPPWLDCLDNAAVGFWFLGGGVLPQDVNADFAWLRDQGFTACAVGSDETRLVAPGVVDTSVADWYSAMAKKTGVPYRMLLGWTEPKRPEMLWNRTPLPYVRAAEGKLAYPDFGHQRLGAFNAFEPIA